MSPILYPILLGRPKSKRNEFRDTVFIGFSDYLKETGDIAQSAALRVVKWVASFRAARIIYLLLLSFLASTTFLPRKANRTFPLEVCRTLYLIPFPKGILHPENHHWQRAFFLNKPVYSQGLLRNDRFLLFLSNG